MTVAAAHCASLMKRNYVNYSRVNCFKRFGAAAAADHAANIRLDLNASHTIVAHYMPGFLASSGDDSLGVAVPAVLLLLIKLTIYRNFSKFSKHSLWPAPEQ